MPKLNGKTSTIPVSKLQSIKVARSWFNLGILPVPLRKKSKRPKGNKGWNQLRVTDETIPMFFNNGDNVGGLWGEPSGWVVDVDLDWDEAARAAPRLLPETFIYGRRKRPCTHYLYKVEGAIGSKRYDGSLSGNPNRTVIAEIRSSGSQSVLPPSIHPEGDRYEINHDTEIKSLNPLHLNNLVDKVSAAALFARNYPGEGARHDYIHAMTGSLLWEGWDDEDVRNFVMAVLDSVERKENDRPQRERTLENTIVHFHEGHKIMGWKSLSQWLTGECVGLIKNWIKTTKKYSILSSTNRIEDTGEEEVIPPKLLHVPGLVGEIAEWSGKRAFLKQPIFDLASGLMGMALMSMNRFLVDNWDTPLQPYMMLIAPTSGGKESAMDSVYTLARKLDLHSHVFQGFQSYHSMLDSLSTPPNTALWLWDEAARKLRTANKSQSGQDYQVITWLLSLYGKANSYAAAVPGRKATITGIDNPFFLTMAAAQPQQMLEAISESDLAQGVANRFVLFDSGDKVPESNLERSNLFPSKFEKFNLRLKNSSNGHFRRIKFENIAVWNRYRDFEYEARQAAFQDEGISIWGRANQNALIFSGLVSLGINPTNPVITQSISEWAIEFIRWNLKQWRMRVEGSSARSMVERRSKSVERYINNPKSFMHRANNEKWIKLLDEGYMPRTLLTRLCRHLTSRDLEDVLGQLITADLVSMGEKYGVEVYWPKR